MAQAVALREGFRPIQRTVFDDRRALRERPAVPWMFEAAPAKPFPVRWSAVKFPSMHASGLDRMLIGIKGDRGMRARAALNRPQAAMWNKPAPVYVEPEPPARATQDVIRTYPTDRGWDRLGKGIHAYVYASPCGEWAYKVSRISDMTRTYLEWCLWKQARGEGMRGMPQIDFLVECDKGYAVGMRRYAKTANECGRSAITDDYGSVRIPAGHYLEALREAFCAETRDCFAMDDLHGGNVMLDERTGEFVITDPSAGSYKPLGSWHDAESFQLTMQ